MNDRILRRKKACEICGLSPSQMDRMEQEGTFPRRRQITKRIIGWSYNEVQRWVDDRLHGKEAQS